MDIGDPLGLLKRRKLQKQRSATFATQIEDTKARIYDELKLVMSDILKHKAKTRKLKINQNIKNKSTDNIKNIMDLPQHPQKLYDNHLNQSPSSHINFNDKSENAMNYSSNQTDSPTYIEMEKDTDIESKSFIPIEPAANSESEPNTLNNHQEMIIDSFESDNDVQLSNDEPSPDDSPLSNDVPLSDTEEYSPNDVCDEIDGFTRNDSSSSDSDINILPLLHRESRSRSVSPVLTLASDICKAKTVIQKLERKLSTSLKNEQSNSRKYKILIKVKKIVRILKYSLFGLCSGVGAYYICQSYSEILALISSNPTPFITSLIFSAASSIARNLFD